MALIENVTGVTKKTLSFRKNVSAIEVVITNTGNTGIVLTDMIAECYIANTKKSKRLQFFPRMRVIDIVEINTTNKERVIYLETVTAAQVMVNNVPTTGTQVVPVDFAWLAKKAIFQIDLTDGVNGVEISGDDDIILELDGLDPANTVNYEFRAIEEADVINNHAGFAPGEVVCYKYEKLTTKQEQNAKFSCVGVLRFGIDRTAAFDSVEIGFKDGSNKKLQVADLDQQARDNFGRAYLTQVTLPGSVEDLQLTREELVPRNNCVIPVDDTMSYIIVNSVEVAGVPVSVTVNVQREQIVGHDVMA